MNKMNKFVLITLTIFVFWGSTTRVHAQEIGCPAEDTEIGTPHGSWPGSLVVCESIYNNTYITEDPQNFYPCTQHITAQGSLAYPYGTFGFVAYVPSESVVRIRFLYWEGSYLFYATPGSEATILVEYITADGLQYDYLEIPVNSFPNVVTAYYGFYDLPYYYRVYMVDFFISVPNGGVTNGLFAIAFQGVDMIGDMSAHVASLQVGSFNQVFPDFCPLPNGDPWPLTPTPPGYVSPTPIATPTGTIPFTYTPAPTAIAGTIMPTRTPTAIVLATLPLIDTPTPYPVISLPTLQFPLWIFPTIEPINTPPPLTVVFPTATPAATNTPFGGGEDGEELGDGVDEMAADIAMLATQWVGVIDAGYEQMALTRTVGITTWVDSFNILVRGPDPVEVEQYAALAPVPVVQAANTMATVISLIKSLQLYAPSLWPVVLTLLISFSLVTGTIIVKVLTNIVWRLLEWIRRLIELIPFAE